MGNLQLPYVHVLDFNTAAIVNVIGKFYNV